MVAVNLDTRNIEKDLTKPIVLIGMMGTGKTHLGKMLADALNLEFFDSDQVIEERGGLSINEIFELYGEKRFRQSEEKTIIDLLECGTCVIATGGGAPMNKTILNTIKNKGISIWLKSDVDAIYERVKQNKSRPLLNNNNPKEILQNLLLEREDTYAQAEITIETKDNNANMALSEMIEAIADIL